MLGATRPALAPALGVAFLTLVAAAGQARPTAAPVSPAVTVAAQDSLRGTVRSVSEDGIEVITGVQYALKLTFIAIDSTTAIQKQGQSVAMERLQPGDLVTVRFQETEQGKTAQSVIVQPPREEGGR